MRDTVSRWDPGGDVDDFRSTCVRGVGHTCVPEKRSQTLSRKFHDYPTSRSVHVWTGVPRGQGLLVSHHTLGPTDNVSLVRCVSRPSRSGVRGRPSLPSKTSVCRHEQKD